MEQEKIYKILAVDDEPTILKVIRRILEGELSDFHMGRINGFDIFRRLAELNKTPAKILITGTPDPSLTEKNLESVGLHGFVLKPWDDDVFKRMVKKALG